MPIVTSTEQLPEKLRERLTDLLDHDEEFILGRHNSGLRGRIYPETTAVTDRRFIRLRMPWLNEDLSEVRLDTISQVDSESHLGGYELTLRGSGFEKEYGFNKKHGEAIINALREQIAKNDGV